ncbi:translesion DNA synthesis-associated protein ImuA [Shewanella gelidimarina]|uniref:translesion DNA synthesis-associated protein ImuA n=1 Tax=Shewanella gelidimarina TaxID=56813 RepID=UPI0020100B2B|nr:translesion DNA synthesis-associated protein ImuA [Shewanella gelidimarina]MCL1060408.1 translesion DNA synthesis-associated protein ImuA [Shewanella gelidimarina]
MMSTLLSQQKGGNMGHSSAKAHSVLQDKEASEQIDNASFRKPVITTPQRVNDTAASASAINQLLARQDIWRGQQWQQQHVAYPTGFSLLDDNLADNGWPQIGVCEILCDGVGQGELSIVLPLLKQLISHGVSSTHANDAMVMLVAPPHIPSPQALLQQGLNTDRLIWIDTEQRKERLWAIEQALASGSVPLVLAWLENLSTTEARRLQLAAEKGQALCMLYLPTRNAQQSHPVNLRLVLQRQCFSALKSNGSHNRYQGDNKQATVIEASMLGVVPKFVEQQQPDLTRFSNSHLGMTEVNIIKRRGGWPSPVFSLPLLVPHLKESLLGVSACVMDNTVLNDNLFDSASRHLDVFAQQRGNVQVTTVKGLANYSAIINSPILPLKAAHRVLPNANDAVMTVASHHLSITGGTILAVNTVITEDKINSASVINYAVEPEQEAHFSLQFEPTRSLSLQSTRSLCLQSKSSLKTAFSEWVSYSIAQTASVTDTLHSEALHTGQCRSDKSLTTPYVDSAQEAWTESYKTLGQGAPTTPDKMH